MPPGILDISSEFEVPGVYMFYFPNLFGPRKGAAYIGEFIHMRQRTIGEELKPLFEDRYYTNPPFQASFHRARENQPGMVIYLVREGRLYEVDSSYRKDVEEL